MKIVINGESVEIPGGGKSAYEYAVDGGYTGTEEEFQALIGSGPWLPFEGADGQVNAGPSGVIQYPVIVPAPDIPMFTKGVFFKGGLMVGNKPINGVADPTYPYDAANRHYVDGKVADNLPMTLVITLEPSGWSESKTYKVNVGYNLRMLEVSLLPGWASKQTADTCNVRCTGVDGRNNFGVEEGWIYFACDTVPSSEVKFYAIFFS